MSGSNLKSGASGFVKSDSFQLFKITVSSSTGDLKSGVVIAEELDTVGFFIGVIDNVELSHTFKSDDKFLNADDFLFGDLIKFKIFN